MSESQVKTGVCVWFDPKKGYGFIRPDEEGPDMFVHFSNVQVDGFKTLKQNQTVQYELGSNHRGTQAVNVVITGELPDADMQ